LKFQHIIFCIASNVSKVSLKRRGDKPDFEVKGLVSTRRSPELEPLAPHIETTFWQARRAGDEIRRDHAG
jgi:hypothetical protein